MNSTDNLSEDNIKDLYLFLKYKEIAGFLNMIKPDLPNLTMMISFLFVDLSTLSTRLESLGIFSPW